MKTYLIFILAFLSIPLTVDAQNVEFKASAPNSVVQGNRFQLVYTINKEGNNLRIPDMQEFQILMGPTTSQRSQVQIVNGKMNREQEFSYTYILKNDQTGTFTIPPATIEVDGKKYQSNSLTIKVVKQEDQQNNQSANTDSKDGTVADDDLFITLRVNKTNVYQSGPVLLTTRIYTRVNLEGISDVQHPSFKSFIAEDITSRESIEWSLENVRGKTYRVGTYDQKIVFPQRSGNLKIEPISIEFLVRMRQTRQSNNVFDNFFDTHRTVRKTVTSDAVTLNVKPLPSPRPTNFSGFVGSLDMDVSASKKQAKVNDGITIKTVISGSGNLKVASAPVLDVPPDFDVFDPNTSSNINTMTSGHKGSKTFEQLIIPRHSGTFEIPPVEYAYFDPSTGQYQTLRSNPIIIEVEHSGEDTTQGGGISATGPTSRNRESIQFLGQDIRYIKTGKSNLKPANTFLFGSWQFALGYIVPLVFFILISIAYRQKIKENANIQLKKTKRANKMARRRLKKAAHLLKSGNHEAFNEELSRGLWGYISDKLAIPGAELNRDNVRQILEQNGAQSDNTEKLLEILDTCEFARYAPSGQESQREDLYKASIEVISRLENNLKKGKVAV